jgi:hypothetical protein
MIAVMICHSQLEMFAENWSKSCPYLFWVVCLKHLFLPSNCRWLRCYQRFHLHPGFNVINILLLQMLWHYKMDSLSLAGFQINNIIATKFELLPAFSWDSLHCMQIIYVPKYFTSNQQYGLFYRGLGKKVFMTLIPDFPQLAVLTNWPSVSSMASCDLNGRQTGRTVSENSMIRSEIVLENNFSQPKL